MKKKILYVITKANFGGAQRYVYDLAVSLPKDVYDILVVSGNRGLLTEKLERSGIRTKSISALKRDISLLSELNSFFALLKIVREEQPDILHVNSSKAGGLGALVGRIAGVKKIIFTAHGWPHEEPRPFLQKIIIYFLSWLTAVLSHTVIVVSEYDLGIAKCMIGVGGKTVRIYNGIDTSIKFTSGDVIRNAFPAGTRIVGTIGELTKNKNQISLIEKARVDPSMYVAIVGEGEDRLYLSKKIEEYGLTDRVKLFGFIPANEVMKGFDVFALPSLKEGLPYVLLEASAANIPIDANHVGGVPEILDATHDFSLSRMLTETLTLY